MDIIKPEKHIRGTRNGVPGRPSVPYITNVGIAKHMAEVLYWDKPRYKAIPLCKQLVDIVLKAVVTGVKRDGKVVIPGLGKFYAYDLPEREQQVNFFDNSNGKPKLQHTEKIMIPARTEIRFRLSKRFKNDMKRTERMEMENNDNK